MSSQPYVLITSVAVAANLVTNGLAQGIYSCLFLGVEWTVTFPEAPTNESRGFGKKGRSLHLNAFSTSWALVTTWTSKPACARAYVCQKFSRLTPSLPDTFLR